MSQDDDTVGVPVVGPRRTLMVIWPILDDRVAEGALHEEALADLPRLAAQAHARLLPGERRFEVRDGRTTPGSGGAGRVLACYAPVEALPRRDYWRRAG